MIPDREAVDKLISVRHYCFVRGVAGRKPESDFRKSFVRKSVRRKSRLGTLERITRPGSSEAPR